MTCGAEPIVLVLPGGGSSPDVAQLLPRCALSLPADGYAFSQEEHGVVSQSQVVRSYDTRQQRPSL